MASAYDKGTTVLDYVEGIEIPGNPFLKPANEFWALAYLTQGLDFLHRQARRVNAVARHRLNPSGDLIICAYGNDPAFQGIPLGLLTCAFQWYALDACKFVRAVGAIAYNLDPQRPKPLDYVKAVIPEVLMFRDKVAAHFAGTTRHANDSSAERLLSVLPQLSFVNDAFHVAAVTVAVSDGANNSNSSEMQSWSIESIHRRLSERYWPATTSQIAH